MKTRPSRHQPALVTVLPIALAGVIGGTGLHAQSGDPAASSSRQPEQTAPERASPDTRGMTVEELEAFIEQRRRELEEAERLQRRTEQRLEDIESKLRAERRRRREISGEVEALCRQREAFEPGSFEGCVEENAPAAIGEASAEEPGRQAEDGS